MVLLEGSIVDNFFEYNPDYLKIELGIFVAIVVISFFRFIFGKVGLFEGLIYSLGSFVISLVIGLNVGNKFINLEFSSCMLLITGMFLITYIFILELALLIFAIKECKKSKGKFEAKIEASYMWGLLLGCARYGWISVGLGLSGLLMYNGGLGKDILSSIIIIAPFILSFVIVGFWKKITEFFINLMLRVIFGKQKIDKI